MSEGFLVPLESDKDIPFAVKRVYYIAGVKAGVVRGKHAHKKLEQILVCLNGKIRVHLDDGSQIQDFVLDSSDKGLYVASGVWRTMEWLTDESILLVIASSEYQEDDYIREYDAFIQWLTDGRDVTQ